MVLLIPQGIHAHGFGASQAEDKKRSEFNGVLDVREERFVDSDQWLPGPLAVPWQSYQ